MTEISIYGKKQHYKIECNGHASGSPEVCAGISSILYALDGWLLNNTDKVKNCVSNMSPGYALIEFDSSTDGKTAFEVAAIGLARIAETYSEYAEITSFNVSG